VGKEEEYVSPKPFLKWAGGKSKLLHKLRPLVPSKYDHYIEPFVGGGALFFCLCPHDAILSDLNSELMNCYRVVRDKPEELIRFLGSMSITKESFYAMRMQNPTNLSDVERAARLIYLNKTCYNGLYRVNKKGQFNTPFGQYRLVKLYNPPQIHAASTALQGVMLLELDFEPLLLSYAHSRDFVYLDPPYPPVGRWSDFKRYTKEFFTEKDHIRLAKVVEELDNRGCKFILSNAMHPLILKLYAKFGKIDVEAPRYINCRAGKRGNVSELLITNIECYEGTPLPTHQIHGKQTDLTTIHIQ